MACETADCANSTVGLHFSACADLVCLFWLWQAPGTWGVWVVRTPPALEESAKAVIPLVRVSAVACVCVGVVVWVGCGPWWQWVYVCVCVCVCVCVITVL